MGGATGARSGAANPVERSTASYQAGAQTPSLSRRPAGQLSIAASNGTPSAAQSQTLSRRQQRQAQQGQQRIDRAQQRIGRPGKQMIQKSCKQQLCRHSKFG